MLSAADQGGLIRGHVDTAVIEFAEAAAKPIGNLAQRIAASELADQHRYPICPATEPFCGTLGAFLLYQCREPDSRKSLKQFIRQAYSRYPSLCPPGGIRPPTSPVKTVPVPEQLEEGLFLRWLPSGRLTFTLFRTTVTSISVSNSPLFSIRWVETSNYFVSFACAPRDQMLFFICARQTGGAKSGNAPNANL